ncbi:MAG: hypothetical protein RSE41_10400 [Clostridia bacterium]
MYYARKLSKNTTIEKLKAKNIDEIHLIEADILKQELSTTGNTLSFWRVECLEEKDDALKAILLSTTSIIKTQFILVKKEIFDKYGLKFNDNKGQTGYKGFDVLHSDMINLNYMKIELVLKAFKEAIEDEKAIPKYEKGKVKELIKEVVESNLLDEEQLNENLKDSIEDMLEKCKKTK